MVGSTSDSRLARESLALTLVLTLVAGLHAHAAPPAHAAGTCATGARSGVEFSQAINEVVARAALTQNWEAGATELRTIVACNDEQQRYKELNIEFLGLQAAAEACQGFLDGSTTGVNLYLACIAPINAALVSLMSELQEAQIAMFDVAPDPDYSSPQIPPTDGEVRATAIDLTRQIYEQASTINALRRGVSRGITAVLEGDPDQALSVIVELSLPEAQAQLAVGQTELAVNSSGTIQLGALPGAQRHLAGAANVPAGAPASQPDALPLELSLTITPVGGDPVTATTGLSIPKG